MPRTALTVAKVVSDGVVSSLASGDSANGHEFTNEPRAYIEVANGGGSSIDVTIITSQTVDGNAVADKVVAVGAGVTKKIGPFNSTTYGSGTNGDLVYVDLSDDTSVTIGAFAI